jgi:cystathionine beta-lyase family protein involved in aluminum resistance
MSTTYYEEDVTNDQEPDPEQQRRDMIVQTLSEYRLNVMAVSEMLAMCSAYLHDDLENRSTDDLEALYAQLVGSESQEVH